MFFSKNWTLSHETEVERQKLRKKYSFHIKLSTALRDMDVEHQKLV